MRLFLRIAHAREQGGGYQAVTVGHGRADSRGQAVAGEVVVEVQREPDYVFVV